jgi:hypothetical protein
LVRRKVLAVKRRREGGTRGGVMEVGEAGKGKERMMI